MCYCSLLSWAFLYSVFILLHSQILVVFLIFLQKSIFFYFEEESYCSGGIPRCYICGLKLVCILIVYPSLF